MALSTLRTHSRTSRYDEDDVENITLLTRQNLVEFERRRTIWKSKTEKSKPDSAFQSRGNRTMLCERDIRFLRPGDHVAWHRPWFVWHHAIVIDTNIEDMSLKVIHWGKKDGKIEIVQDILFIDKEFGQFYRIDYEEEIKDMNPAIDVIQRAKNKMGEKNYSPFSNNCESFATYCKTGNAESCQVNWLREQAKRALLPSFEGVYLLKDLLKFRKRLRDGHISTKDFLKTSIHRNTEACFVAIGALSGVLIGASIGSAVPVVGTITCGLIGNYLGAVVGRVVGSFLGYFVGRFVSWMVD